MYESHRIEGDKIVVKLTYIYDGLKTQDGKAPNWFQLSDETVANRKHNLVNAGDLPAVPFRTDG
jgi:hypothetical protein